jgi:hypothetical protein
LKLIDYYVNQAILNWLGGEKDHQVIGLIDYLLNINTEEEKKEYDLLIMFILKICTCKVVNSRT